MINCRNNPRNKWKARKADRKEKTIAGRLVRELERNLSPDSRYQSDIDLFKRILNQKKSDKNKIYSVHEPRNFYKGITGDNINVVLAAAAFNFKRMINKWKSSFQLVFKNQIVDLTNAVSYQINNQIIQNGLLKAQLSK